MYVVPALTTGTYSLSYNQLMILGGLKADNMLIGVISSLFLSGNGAHLLLNVLIGLIMLSVLKGRYSLNKLALLFIFSGIASNLISVALQPEVLTYGASGCNMGLGGLIIADVLRNVIRNMRYHANKVSFLVGLLVIILMFRVVTSGNESTNYISHLAGMCIGLLSEKWMRYK